LAQFESILKKEDNSYQAVNFKIGKEEVQTKDVPLLDFILNKNLKIEVNRRIFPIDIDLNGPIAYHNKSPLDKFLSENEVPINDSLLISTFINIYHENLEKAFPKAQAYNPKQLSEALEQTIKTFRAKNDKQVEGLTQVIEKLVVEQAKEESEFNKLVTEAQKKASGWIKYVIIATCIQFGVLFYMTYYTVGWDVVEPIGYLIALGIEVAGMIYFVRYAKNLEQRAIFNTLYHQHKHKVLGLKSTNPEAELDFIKRRVKYMTQKVLYSKAK
jgi:ABC-type multidrug transport system fused ATPase/permease subunit